MTATEMPALAATVAEYNAQVERAAQLLPFDHPIKAVRWVHIDHVRANDYNPNSVATNELKLLHISISADGYTQPVVVIEESPGRYVIVDGFHRYSIMRLQADVQETTGGYLPVVVIDKDPAERMAATIRHNRARGKHSVAGMSNLVFEMFQEGMSDAQICNLIGLEAQELLRLKHITGFSKLLQDHEYTQAWETQSQLRIKQEWAAEHPEEPPSV